MPAKKSKTRTSKKTLTNKNNQFKWYLAIILVALVAIAGLFYIQFSHASSGPTTSYKSGHICKWLSGAPYCSLVYGQEWGFYVGSAGYSCDTSHPSFSDSAGTYFECYPGRP